MVLGGRPDHRGAADVDLLDDLVRRRARGDRLLERVEVGDQQVERLDVQVFELLYVVGVAPVGEQPGVHLRVQGLDPAVQALGEAGELLDLHDRYAGGGDAGRRRSGGDDLDAGLVQPLGELLQARLVVDADQRTLDRDPGQPILTLLLSMVHPSRTRRPTVSHEQRTFDRP